MTNTVVYEMNNFINIFWVNFAGEKISNLKTSYLSFYCEFEVISNTGLKSRVCSGKLGLQNFILVEWELARDEAVKWWDPFRNSKKKKKNGAAECAPAREEKSSIKFGLRVRKGNKSKWHSTQIFFNS